MLKKKIKKKRKEINKFINNIYFVFIMVRRRVNETLWYTLRISFYFHIGFFIISMFLIDISYNMDLFLGLINISLSIFIFIASILHLKTYSKKAFSIVSLVFSSIYLFYLMLSFTIGFIFGILNDTSLSELNDLSEGSDEKIFNDLCLKSCLEFENSYIYDLNINDDGDIICNCLNSDYEVIKSSKLDLNFS